LVAVLSEVPGLLAKVDQMAMARYAADSVEYVRCREQLRSEGLVATTEKGGVYQHPLVGIRNKCHERMSKFEALFGMTAADRARLDVTHVVNDEEDELEGMLA
jgi:P27 family predicted phage terminase small subunit